ncbi:uncharacterized protein MONBRDRAFT_32409 [Monosiga brevicollis MX1]|uniref:Elongation factor-like 1 n=1 Tax=Monosiga brevicollis TaxID=81824 RepID=A9UZC6_MONBE|nr:uncharacterized protein MONBRDRAFT_32409 [Monosiga brevicollis MX1]EDQ89343.1 predicted protein [Monosiga brevicollis MX1]|eukprot:XP_001745919.1 hypothetical protein [Monosiga brevicollis MX1]
MAQRALLGLTLARTGRGLALRLPTRVVGSTPAFRIVNAHTRRYMGTTEHIEQDAAASPLERMAPDRKPSFDDTMSLLRKAQHDPLIHAVWLDLDGYAAPLTRTAELVQRIQQLQAAGTKVYVYGTVITHAVCLGAPQLFGIFIIMPVALVGAAAERFFAPSSASVNLHGFSFRVSAYKPFLQKLGLDVEAVRSGEFKGIVDTFAADDVNPAVVQNMGDLLRGMTKSYTERLSQLVESLDATAAAQLLVDSPAIDDLAQHFPNLQIAYKDEAYADVVRTHKPDAAPKTRFVVPEKRYARFSLKKIGVAISAKSSRVGVIRCGGTIVSGKGQRGSFGQDNIIPMLWEAHRRADIDAVVLRVDSSGGSALASDLIAREVARLAAVKPVVASFGTLAASGGYYISALAHTIVADPMSITGSIGVAMLRPNGQKLIDDMMGVRHHLISEPGPLARVNDFYAPMSPEVRAYLDKRSEEVYHAFLKIVCQGRGMSLEEAEKHAKGQVFSAEQAQQRGLVDQLGSLQDAVDQAAKLAQRRQVTPGQTLYEVLRPKMSFLQRQFMGSNKFVIDALGFPNINQLLASGIVLFLCVFALYLSLSQTDQTNSFSLSLSLSCLSRLTYNKPFLINVIDSPGHIDFSYEVSSAVRLSDGCIVLVDVVEGVSAQTHAVLRQAWMENLKPCLVLNKLDRLILELQMTPEEAYEHMQRILEQVNAITASLFTSRMIARLDQEQENTTDTGEGAVEFEWDDTMDDDSGRYFEPENGNVAFASGYDGWAFSVDSFATLLAQKFKCSERALRRCLWGDYYLTREKGVTKVKKGARMKAKTPMFVKFVLEPIWELNKVIMDNNDRERMQKMIAALNVKVSARELLADPRTRLTGVMSAWLPLAKTILDLVCRVLPSPKQLETERFHNLLNTGLAPTQALPEARQRLAEGMCACAVDEAAPAVVAYVSKMVAVPRASLPENERQQASMEELQKRRASIIARRKAEAGEANVGEANSDSDMPLVDADGHPLDANTNSNTSTAEDEATAAEEAPEDPIAFVAYARVFSGTLRPGMQIHVLSPKYDPARPTEHVTTVTVGRLYLFMGRSMLPLQEAVAGTVVGIGGLDGTVLKSATLSSSLECPPLSGMYQHVKPIVRVALETERIQDMAALKRGLILLNQADPCVETYVQETGEHVLVAAGEVHIERCLTDLKEQFAPGIKIHVSPPIIPFRETVIPPPKMDQANEEIALQADKGERNVYLLDDSVEVDDDMIVTVATADKAWTLRVRAEPLPSPMLAFLDENQDGLRALTSRLDEGDRSDPGTTEESEERARAVLEAFQAAVANKDDPCDLLPEDVVAFGPRGCGPNILASNLPELQSIALFAKLGVMSLPPAADLKTDVVNALNSFKVGFEIFAQTGPLCDEPVRGVCIRAFLVQPCRLMLAMFKCNLLVNSNALGKVYTVINKRGGRVVSEEMKDGSDSFEILAHIPVTNSFGFAEELRKRSSGLAVPQLIFSHWEVLEEDPFWIPTTEEEKAHFGDKGDAPNVARDHMNGIRKRKGLAVEEKLVEHAEKQRTMARKK